MKLILVQPTTTFKDGRPHKTKKRWIMGLTLPYLAGLTPRGVDVELLDDRMEEIRYDGGYDLVALTTTIATASRAYQIAADSESGGSSTPSTSSSGWTRIPGRYSGRRCVS